MNNGKKLHLDLTRGSPAQELMNLGVLLSEISAGRVELSPQDIDEHSIKLANQDEYEHKYSELLGTKHQYRVTDFAKPLVEKRSAIGADYLAQRLLHTGTTIDRIAGHSIVVVPNIAEIIYDDRGVIIASDVPEIRGHDALHYLACCIAEDIALVTNEDGKLVYAFDCSMYEKTPKDPLTGINNYVGRDLLEFHGRAKTHGAILPVILRNLTACMQSGALDQLTIDLIGNNTYSDGKIHVRRHETDYVEPIMTQNGLAGLMAHAEVIFRETKADGTPNKQGRIIRLWPKFHEVYQVMPDGNT